MSVPAAGMESTTVSKRATVTQEEQRMVEDQVFRSYYNFSTLPPNSQSVWLELQRDNHIEYLTNGLRQLNSSFVVLDANRPWLCYWILHSIALLGESVDPDLEHNAIDFLSRCQDKDGGYGGGPGQMPHLATTYAAVNSLITLGGQNSLSSINRDKIYSFLQRMKQKSGGFSMHDGGEVDVRACYTAISVASALNILDNYLTENVGNYILSCQTYEGGISGEPGSEAHGGYTFCGLATMILINETYRLDLASLTDWIVFRQGAEGGFQGRTNKLVDGCYSFWQGGAAVLLQKLHAIAGEGHCSSGSTESSKASDLSEDEHCLEGTSSDVGESYRNREEDISDFTKLITSFFQTFLPSCLFSRHIRFYKAHNKFLSDLFALLSILFYNFVLILLLLNVGQQNASDQVNSSNFGSKRGYTKPGPLFQSIALQQYIILISQMEGGFRDKPGKGRDHYHTCYCLSGLSSSQYSWSENGNSPPIPSAVLGPYSNLLEPINPLYNIVAERYNEASEFFASNF